MPQLLPEVSPGSQWNIGILYNVERCSWFFAGGTQKYLHPICSRRICSRYTQGSWASNIPILGWRFTLALVVLRYRSLWLWLFGFLYRNFLSVSVPLTALWSLAFISDQDIVKLKTLPLIVFIFSLNPLPSISKSKAIWTKSMTPRKAVCRTSPITRSNTYHWQNETITVLHCMRKFTIPLARKVEVFVNKKKAKRGKCPLHKH